MRVIVDPSSTDFQTCHVSTLYFRFCNFNFQTFNYSLINSHLFKIIVGIVKIESMYLGLCSYILEGSLSIE